MTRRIEDYGPVVAIELIPRTRHQYRRTEQEEGALNCHAVPRAGRAPGSRRRSHRRSASGTTSPTSRRSSRKAIGSAGMASSAGLSTLGQAHSTRRMSGSPRPVSRGQRVTHAHRRRSSCWSRRARGSPPPMRVQRHRRRTVASAVRGPLPARSGVLGAAPSGEFRPAPFQSRWCLAGLPPDRRLGGGRVVRRLGVGCGRPTLAVLVITPLALGVTGIATSVRAPYASGPRSRRPGRRMQQPADAPTNVTPAGSVSRCVFPAPRWGRCW